MLAAFGDRPPEQVPEGIDSMELAWLGHQTFGMPYWQTLRYCN